MLYLWERGKPKPEFYRLVIRELESLSEVEHMEIDVAAVCRAMANKGMNASQLARKAGISLQTATRFACRGGKSSAPTFYKVGQALGVEPGSLILQARAE